MTILQKPLRPNSASATDVANVLHPYTDLVSHAAQGPVIIARGKGVQVWDEDGKDYIEGVAGLWCASLGFDNERLAKAAYDQLRTLPFYHSFGSKSHGPLIDLAERLIALAPVPMARVMFSNSGSEANDTAIKMIWYFNNAMGRPQKKKIIGRLKGYHGVTLAAASLTGLPNNHRSFDLPLPGFVHTMTPHFYHEGLAGENEEDFATRCADELERLILTEGPDTVAGFFARTGSWALAASSCRRMAISKKIQAVSAPLRRALRRRRGHLRLWPHRPILGQPKLRDRARHSRLRQGAIGELRADLGDDRQYPRLRGDCGGEPSYRGRSAMA